MPKGGGDSSNINISRDSPGGRFPNSLTAEAVEADLGNITQAAQQASQSSVPNLTVTDGVTTVLNANKVTVTGSLAVTAGAANEAIVSDGSTGSSSTFKPFLDADFVAASGAGYDEHVDTNTKSIVLTSFDEYRYVIHQTGATGGTYQFQYWDGAAWQNIGSSFTTAGTATLSYTSGWISIPAGTIALGDVITRVQLVASGGGSTDTSLCTIQLRGPAVVGAQGPVGPAGTPPAATVDGAILFWNSVAGEWRAGLAMTDGAGTFLVASNDSLLIVEV